MGAMAVRPVSVAIRRLHGGIQEATAEESVEK